MLAMAKLVVARMPAARVYGELGSYNHTVSMRHISTDLLGIRGETSIFIPIFRLSKSLECITV